MKFQIKMLLTVTVALLALEGFAQQHGTGIEFQMGPDEQLLVGRTYDNAESFHNSAQAAIKDLKAKISKSSGSQLEARKARMARIETMDKMINGCLIKEWDKLEGQRAGTAEIIDQLIRNFQTNLEE